MTFIAGICRSKTVHHFCDACIAEFRGDIMIDTFFGTVMSVHSFVRLHAIPKKLKHASWHLSVSALLFPSFRNQRGCQQKAASRQDPPWPKHPSERFISFCFVDCIAQAHAHLHCMHGCCLMCLCPGRSRCLVLTVRIFCLHGCLESRRIAESTQGPIL